MAMTTTTYEYLLDAATRAPSSHNTQPWRFARAGDAIEVFADRSRGLPVNDPHDRELLISCGCALGNLEAAARALGAAPRVETMPDGPDADRLARVHLAPVSAVPAGGVPVAIAARCTHRGDVAPDGPDAALEARLQDTRIDDVHLCIPGAAARDRAAVLVERGDRAQWDDPRWRRELALWMRTRPAPDGLAVPAGIAPLTRAVVRAADLGGAVGPRDAASVRAAPWLAIVATRTDDPAAWLATGRVLQHVLLEAAAAGFQAAWFNQPIQVEALRADLAVLCGGLYPQVMFRLGRPLGRVAARSARRSVAEVSIAVEEGEAQAC